MIDLAKEKKEIQVVNDQFGSPTWTLNVIRQIKKLMPTDFYGTYHCTSQGHCSWFEFAIEIFKEIGYKTENSINNSLILKNKNPRFGTKNTIKIKEVTSDKFKTHAKRPKNSVLENYMLKIQNLDIMPHWKESLTEFMDILKKSEKYAKT